MQLPLLLLLHYLIAIPLLLPHSATSSALPSPPEPQPLSPALLLLPATRALPPQNPAPRPPAPKPPAPKPLPTHINCYQPGPEDHKPIDSDNCSVVIDVILHESIGPMTYHKFGHKQTPPDPAIFTVPSAWRVDECVIILSSVNEDDVETFRFVDVVKAADRILRECSAFSKFRLGGVITLGSKTFYVSVDAPPDDVGRGGGGGGNGTAMGMGMGIGGGGFPVVDVGSYSRGRRLLV